MLTSTLAVHGILGIVAFGALMFPGMYFGQIAKTENVAAIRAAYTIAANRGKIFGPMVIVAALFGFWVAAQAGIPLTSGWLIASYVVVVILMALGFGFHARLDMQTLAAAQASPLDKPSPELLAAIHNPMHNALNIASGLLWVVLFYLMIAKPF